MIYTKMTEKAMNIAYNAHHGQVDKSGVPYIFHPFHVAEQMDDEESTCAALLHDVAEDTEVTFEQMATQGISESVIEALKLLCHDKNEPYMDYIRRLAPNPIARKVKLADLAHNMDESRCPNDPKYEERMVKYREAREYLMKYTGESVC